MKTYTSEQVADPKNAKLFNEIAYLLAHAMTEDSCSKWLFSNHSRDEYVAVLPPYMRILVQMAITSKATFRVITRDEVPSPSPTVVSENSTAKQPTVQVPSDATLRAIAILVPPHGNAIFDSMPKQIRAGAWAIPQKCGLRMTWRLLHEFLPKMGGMHDVMFPESSTKYHNWHLFHLAVHPENRGQGLGAQLLRDIQQEVKQFNEDEAAKAKAKVGGKAAVVAPLYLEASSYVNKRLYSRVGFEEKTDMIYGKLADGENLNVAENGKVLGGRQFGMVWTP